MTALTDTPLYLNLGNDSPGTALANVAARRRLRVVQTGLDESKADRAERLAADLHRLLRPETTIVTVGRFGALAYTDHGTHRCGVPTIATGPTHGAGAAFSAGYAHALLTGADVETALRAGCHTGTLHCTTTGHLSFALAATEKTPAGPPSPAPT